MRLPCCRRNVETSYTKAGFGAHEIGFLGGLCLLTNNILGSGMVQIPSLFTQSGWVVPTVFFFAIGAWTCVSALYLARTIAQLPNNRSFGQRVEYSNVLQALFPKWAYFACLFMLIGSFLCQNVSNVIVSAQVADDILLATAKKTCALVLYPSQPTGPFTCVSADNDTIIDDSPFGSAYTVSIGWLLVAALTIPLSWLALDSNVLFQIGGVFLIILCVIIWAIQFCALGLSASNMPAFAPPTTQTGFGGFVSAYSPIISTVLFNFGFVATCPSWLNEKGPSVSVSKTITRACIISIILYLILGFFGALSPLNFASGKDVLSLLADGSTPGIWTLSKVAVFIFPAANLMTSIPVFAVMIRYNLVNAGLMRPWVANVVAIGSPWLLSLIFYSGNQLSELINWSSALFFVVVNLVAPVALFLRQLGGGAAGGAVVMPAASGGSSAWPWADDSSNYDAASESGAGNMSILDDAAETASASAPLLLPLSSLNALGALQAGAAAPAAKVEEIHPAPACCRKRLSLPALARALLGASVAVSLVALALQAYNEYQNDTGS